jgi:hypothetical protein
MVQDMKVCGKTIFSMEKEKKVGLMDRYIKVNMEKVKNMEEAFTVGVTEVNMMDFGLKIR